MPAPGTTDQVSVTGSNIEIEPWAPPPEVRLSMLRQLAAAGLDAGISVAPVLPGRTVSPTTDAATGDRHRASLAAAERAFSDRAQVIGLGPAFREFGAPTAVNMGGPASAPYVVGNDAIATLIGASSPQPTSPVEWSTDVALVASSGDLGISFGFIRPHATPGGATSTGSPFFTIWHRVSPEAPWRYVAE